MGTFSILTNVPSLNAQNNLKRTQLDQARSMGRLSSGLRINRAGDDAAGLAISENLKAQIRSLGQAERNANDGISLLQTAEGSMNEVSGILTRMRELAMQSSTDTVGDSERAFVQQEFSALMEEIDRIANVTEFNGTQLLDGSATGLDFQVGIRDTANDRITVAIADMRSAALGTGGGGAAIGTAGVDSRANAQASLDIIDAAIQDVSAGRAGIGAAGRQQPHPRHRRRRGVRRDDARVDPHAGRRLRARAGKPDAADGAQPARLIFRGARGSVHPPAGSRAPS